VLDQSEHPFSEDCDAPTLQAFFESLCARFLGWAQSEMAHRQRRDAGLQALEFPQLPFRAGQREMAASVYRACLQSRPLLVQAPTGIGKTMGTLYPALRAVPERGLDKVFYLTAKTPGRQVALQALEKACASPTKQQGTSPRVLELVARDKSCEHPEKACHGQSCPLARGFYDRLPDARQAAAHQGWLDQAALRTVALAHDICPYYLGHEMVRWVDVVVGDYNYYFDRSAMLYTLATSHNWRVTVLVDEAHNLYSRACSMYSATLTEADTIDLHSQVPPVLRPRVAELLNHWQLVAMSAQRQRPDTAWRLLNEVPQDWLRGMQRFNNAVGEYLNEQAAEAPGAWLPFYFQTLAFAGLAEEFGEHSLCELVCRPNVHVAGSSADCLSEASQSAAITLRNIVPGHFIAPRVVTADSLILFSATLNPTDYYINLLGLPDTTQRVDIDSPFAPEQLAVRIKSLSTRRNDRLKTLDALVDTLAEQFDRQSGNYLAFFSSFDYLELAFQRLRQRHPEVPLWSQQRQMGEASRHAFLHQFDVAGQGIGFAVLGGVFGEGVDLPGKRLIGAFIATLGLPQFDDTNQVICERMQARFGRGYDYTYVYPGLQKVVQAAGRVIRTHTDTGTVFLLDERYREFRYRQLLPSWWKPTLE
jgi:DNA excision repair protein ERCC-2